MAYCVSISRGQNVNFYVKEVNGSSISYEELRRHMSDLTNPFVTFDIVHFTFGDSRYLAIVDDEGLLKPNEVNGFLYLATGETIVGDCLIVADHNDEDMYYLNEDELEDLLIFSHILFDDWE